MKSTFFIISALALILYTSCEKQHEKPSPKIPRHGTGSESPSPAAGTASSRDPAELPSSVVVSPATMNRVFKEGEEAFNAKEYSTAVAKYEELARIVPPNKDGPHEMLYFQIGLGKFLGGKYPEATTAFKDCIERFPNGKYTSRAYLGLGRACLKQDLPGKKEDARRALKMAAADPIYKAEAELWISRIP